MKIGLLVLGILLALFGVWVLWGWLSVRGIEEPKYTVQSSNEVYEVRVYEPQLIAKTTVKGEMEEALNEGFRRIAAFIFGENTTQESVAMTAPVTSQENTSSSIAMTAPVTAEETEPDQYTISFVMPSKYTLETLPLPLNKEVIIEEMPQKTYAVLEFSGYAPQEKVQEKIALLKESLAQNKVQTLSNAILSQYNPPWTPWFMRRNEIWIEIDS